MPQGIIGARGKFHECFELKFSYKFTYLYRDFRQKSLQALDRNKGSSQIETPAFGREL